MVTPVSQVRINNVSFRGEQPQQAVILEKSNPKPGGNQMLWGSLAALGTLGAAGLVYLVTRGRSGTKNIAKAGSEAASNVSENAASEAKRYLTADMFKDEDLSEVVRRYLATRIDRPIDSKEEFASSIYFILYSIESRLYVIYLEKLVKCKTPEELLAVKNAIMQKKYNIPDEVLESANSKKAEERIAHMVKDEKDVVFPDNATPQEKFKILFDRSIKKAKDRLLASIGFNGEYFRELEEAIKNNDKKFTVPLYSEIMRDVEMHLDWLS